MEGQAIGPIEGIELRKDGTEIRISYTAAPIRGRDGELIGAARIIRELPDSQPFPAHADAKARHTSLSDE
jgi:hypothetical protein